MSEVFSQLYNLSIVQLAAGQAVKHEAFLYGFAVWRLRRGTAGCPAASGLEWWVGVRPPGCRLLRNAPCRATWRGCACRSRLGRWKRVQYCTGQWPACARMQESKECGLRPCDGGVVLSTTEPVCDPEDGQHAIKQHHDPAGRSPQTTMNRRLSARFASQKLSMHASP